MSDSLRLLYVMNSMGGYNDISCEELGKLFGYCEVDNPEFFFLASNLLPWHGLDLMLESARTVKAKFKVNLLGKLNKE